jgi:hypothetical protein
MHVEHEQHSRGGCGAGRPEAGMSPELYLSYGMVAIKGI